MVTFHNYLCYWCLPEGNSYNQQKERFKVTTLGNLVISVCFERLGFNLVLPRTGFWFKYVHNHKVQLLSSDQCIAYIQNELTTDKDMDILWIYCYTSLTLVQSKHGIIIAVVVPCHAIVHSTIAVVQLSSIHNAIYIIYYIYIINNIYYKYISYIHNWLWIQNSYYILFNLD